MENKRDHGLRTENCTNCLRPFSVALMDETLCTGKCVFCRIEERQQEYENYKSESDWL